ncbi:MAG: purine-binding chemotaxis protein CheW [Oscillospiraceae bacterium]|nr:purine-binding chemotaxis protein CheW [Oscillospiraceae bacterium]
MAVETDMQSFAASGGEVLTFTIDGAVYGIEIKYINEIISYENITVVPKVPQYIKGVINIRGQIVPIISVRKRFGKEEIPPDERTCIIVLEFDGANQVGIIVDRVREVVTAKPENICATPQHKNVNATHYIKYIIEDESGIKLLLNCEKLVLELDTPVHG